MQEDYITASLQQLHKCIVKKPSHCSDDVIHCAYMMSCMRDTNQSEWLMLYMLATNFARKIEI